LLNRSKKSIGRYVRRGLLHPEKVKSQQGTLEYRFSKTDIEEFKTKEAQKADGTEETRQDGTTLNTPQPETELSEAVKEPTGETGQSRQDNKNPLNDSEKIDPTEKKETTEQDKKEFSATLKKEETRQATGDRTQKPEQKITSEPERELNPEQTGQDKTRETGRDSEVISLLKETTGLLRDQLKVKDTQIESLGGKIDQLIERDRETNIILKSLEEKVFMLGQGKKPDQTEETGQTRQDGTGQKESQPQVTSEETGRDEPVKKRFWKRLFN